MSKKNKNTTALSAFLFLLIFFVPIGAFGYYSSGAELLSSPFLSSSGLSSFDSYELEQLKADSFRMKQEINELKRKADCEKRRRLWGDRYSLGCF